jgi:hypothetical protein
VPGIDAQFTPEACPGLSPEFCTFLNTPLEDCDPDMLRVLLAALADTLAELMPPEANIADLSPLFATLRGLAANAPDATGLDPLPAVPPPSKAEPVPAEPAAASDSQALASPAVPPEALPAAPVLSTDTRPDAQSEPSPSLPEPQQATPEDDTAPAAIPVSAITPDATSLPEPISQADRQRPDLPPPGLPWREHPTIIPGMIGKAEALPVATAVTMLPSRQQIADPPPPTPIPMRAKVRPGRPRALPRPGFARVATGPPTGPPFDRDLQLCRACTRGAGAWPVPPS